MRNPEHEIFNARQEFTYDTKLNKYTYRGVTYELIEDFIPELYQDCLGGVGITYCSGKDKIDFSLAVEDNETTIFSINEKEWETFRSVSQIPKHLHFAVYIESMMAVIAHFKEDR